MKVQLLPLEFDIILCEGKNYTGNINMKTLMNTAMTTIMKSSLCALAVLLAASAFADATFNGVTYVDLTTDGAGTASSTNAAYYGYSMPGCFDNSWAGSADRGMCGYTTTYPAMYVDYAFNTATAVNAYSVRNAGNGGSNQTERAPNTWTFEGSDDGVNWTVLDARTNETGWASAEIRLYKFVNTHAYTQYRYSCTVINGGNCFQVHEIEFYNTTAPLVTSSFSKKLVFTVAGHVGSEDLKHFPVLVRLSTAINGFDYADCGTDGAGLRFADADGNLLHHEIDTWNTAGESLVWVDLPHCRANETFTLYLAADDPAALQTIYPTEVWDNAGIPAVWHMNEVKADSSGHSYTYYDCGTLGTISAGGAAGNRYDGTGGGGWSIGNNTAWSGYGEGGKVAYTAWVSRNAADSGIERYVFSTANISLTSTSTDSSYTWKLYNGTTVLLTVTTDADIADWSQVAVVSGSGAIKLYFNGELAGTYTGNIPASPTAFRIGAKNTNGDNRWKSYLDEVRIHRAEESAEYVRASYATVASAGFLTNTGVQSTGAILPLAVRADQATLSGTTATITGRLSNLGTGATEADVTLYYSTTSDVESGTVAGTTNLTEAADLSDTLAGLTAGATYYYAYKAVNNLSATAWSATNSFVVEASTRFSDTIAIATQNCQMTVTGTMTDWGLGTTVVELLVGTSADNLAVVQTVNLSQRPANDQVVFDPVTMPVGTYVVAIRATTTYNDIVWVRETTTTSQALSDTSTYTWKGGKGDWADSAMWASSDTGAAGVPSAASSVVFGDADSDVTLAADVTVAGLTVSSVGTHAFRSDKTMTARKLTGPVAMSGTGGGSLVLDSVKFENQISDLAGLRQLVIENMGWAEAASSAATDIVLVNGGTFYGGVIYGSGPARTFGKLKLVGGPNRISFNPYTQYGIRFASFEAVPGSGAPVVGIRESANTGDRPLVAFDDATGIELVGGDASLADATSKIPVCPNFMLNDTDTLHGKGACTIVDGEVRKIPQSTMLTTLAGATETDNVCITNDFTLTEDVTVNAFLFQSGNIDLGGHTVTVRSGVFREGDKGMFGHLIQNGVVKLGRPDALGDGTNNTDARNNVDFAVDGNSDPEVGMLAHNAPNDGWNRYATYAAFVGTFAAPPNKDYSVSGSMRGTNAVVEMRGGAIRRTGDHGEKTLFRGVSGVGSINFQAKWNCVLWLGDLASAEDQEYFNSLAGRVVVGHGGIVKPGCVDYDGGRRGCFSIPYVTPQGDLPKLRALEFRDGAKLKVTLRPDGTCSWLDASQTQSAGTFLDVTLAGDLVLEEAGRVKSGNGPWIVLKTGKETTGSFANAGANGRGIQGYKVSYNVALPDGTYGVKVEKKGNAGTVIIVR